MGFLIKILIFAVAAYGVWSIFNTWRRGLGAPPVARKKPPEQATVDPGRATVGTRKPVIEDTEACRICGAFVSAGATRCGRTDCPLN
jgi:hypothetical protein